MRNNDELLNMREWGDIMRFVRTLRLKYAGLVQRMQENRIPRMLVILLARTMNREKKKLEKLSLIICKNMVIFCQKFSKK